MEDNIKEMSMVKLEQLKKSIEKEIALRKREEKKEAQKEIYNSLKTIQALCIKYNIELYDEKENLISLNEIEVVI